MFILWCRKSTLAHYLIAKFYFAFSHKAYFAVNYGSFYGSQFGSNYDSSHKYLWTVYPKTPPTDLEIGLYLSLIGVKAPSEYTELIKTELQDQADSFSIQGEVIYQNFDSGIVTVKIQQTPRNQNGTPKEFRLKLLGFLPPKSARHFWNLHVRRVGTDLVIQSGQCIKFLHPKKSKTKKISTIPSDNSHELAEVNAQQQSTE